MRPTKIILGSDHGGFALKQELREHLAHWGWEVEDIGCSTSQSVDYPDFAAAVAKKVAAGEAPFGLLVCGTGIGMCIAANKVRGVRAALCQETYSARMARAHNNANVLCIGGRVIGPELAREVLAAFLEASFEGERHQRRLEKISSMED
jgi:ribose 5-phosphate isomerase B